MKLEKENNLIDLSIRKDDTYKNKCKPTLKMVIRSINRRVKLLNDFEELFLLSMNQCQHST